jgi:hypothetical protein
MGELHSWHLSAAMEAAWQKYLLDLEALRQGIYASELAVDPADQARAHYWFMQAQAAAFNLVIAPKQSQPVFSINTVFEPNLYTWLLPNADFLYRYVFFDGTRNFLIRGKRGSSHFLEAQTISGFWGDPELRLLASYDFERFALGSDGTFEIAVGPAPPEGGGNWIATDPNSANNTMIVREAFYDWVNERPAELRIESVEPDERPTPPAEPEFIRRLEAASRMMQFCFKTFSGGLTQDVVKAVGTNNFLLVDTSKDEHAANPSAGYVPVVYDLQADEALIIELEAPKARYWNLHLGDVWWQVTDYTYHQSSLNGHQVAIDRDGKARLVIALRDPGVANWLDPVGNLRGVALLRWYFTDHYPVPITRRVPFDRLWAELPEDTIKVDFSERQRALTLRRDAVLRRYGH